MIVNCGKECRGRTADPEHEADLHMGEENVRRTKRVFQRVVDVLAQSSVIIIVIVGVIEQPRSGRDHVVWIRHVITLLHHVITWDRSSSRNVAAASRIRKQKCDSVCVMNLAAGQRSARDIST